MDKMYSKTGNYRTKTNLLNGTTKRSYFLLSFPSVVLYTLFLTVPTIFGFCYSFTNWNGISPKYDFVGLKNYINMFSDARLLSALKFTFVYTFWVVAFIIVFSIFIALLLNSNIEGRGFFRAAFFFPAVLSLITVGLIFNQIFFQVVPIVGQSLGIEWLSTNILGNGRLAILGIIITNVWQGIAMPSLIFLAGLQSIPKDLYEAAIIDGAGAWQRFKSLTLPFLIPMLNVNLVLAIRNGLTVFDYIKAMTDGGPGTATESIALLIYKNGFQQMKFSYGAAESILLFVLVIIISVIQLKTLNKKEVGQL